MLYVLILVFCIDAADVQRTDLEDSKYSHGTLKVHHIDTGGTGHIDQWCNLTLA